MSKHPDYLIVRNGTYYYKRRVPLELRDRPVFKGQDFYQRSLGVKTLKEARLKSATLGYDDLFENNPAHIDTKPRQVVLTHQMLEQIGASRYEKNLERLQSNRLSEPDEVREPLDDYAINLCADLNCPVDGQTARALLRRELDEVHRIEAEWIAERLGIEPSQTSITQLVDVLLDVEIKTQMSRADFALGHSMPTHRGMVLTSASKAPIRKEAFWRFTDVAEAAMAQNPTAASWEHKVRIASQMLDSYVGQKPIYKITEMHIRDFMDEIKFMPANMKQRFPNLTLEQAIKTNRARARPFKTISANTARDGYLAVLKWVFKYARERNIVSENPCKEIFVKGATKSKGAQKANPFTVTELNALFQRPIFTGAKSTVRANEAGHIVIDDHRKWVPLTMLFTGARPSEIAQLSVSDIKEEDGVPYISILTEYDPDDPDDDRDYIVSFKTENAARNIPIHPTLAKVGFLEYVQRMRDNREVRLFPEWKRSDDSRKLYSSASWVNHFNNKVIPSATSRLPKPTLYSFRHTWKTQMAIHMVPPQYQNQLLGHAQQGMDGHYLGRMGVEHTYAAIKNIAFDGLNLNHLTTS